MDYQYGVIIGVIIYELVVIIGAAAFLRHRAAKKAAETGSEGFALGGRDMGVATLAPTIALTVLGAAHITGVFEMSYGMGAIAIWFSMAHIIMICVACFATGQWVRKLGVVTVPEIIKGMYGPGVAMCVTATMAGCVFGVLVNECQGMGIVINALTGWPLINCVVVGGIIGILYVVFAGMKEVGAVNLVNTIVMYVGLIIATAYICQKLGGSFNYINDAFVGDEAFMTNVMGNKQLFISFAMGQIIAVTFCQSISQMLMQTMASAKSSKTIRQAVWIAAPVNGLFGVFAVCLGLAARANPEFAAYGPKSAAMNMLVHYLPTFLAALLLAALLAAILSTFAMTSLTPATLWVNDIFVPYFAPDADEKKKANATRILIIIIACYAMFVSTALPTILDAISWTFSWSVPVWFIVCFGLFWKRKKGVVIATLLVCWIINILWSFTGLPAAIGGVIGSLANALIIAVVTIVILVIGNLIPGGEPSYMKAVGFNPDDHD